VKNAEKHGGKAAPSSLEIFELLLADHRFVPRLDLMTDFEVDLPDVGAGAVDEGQGHIQVRDLLLELLQLFETPRALNDDVLQIQAMVIRSSGGSTSGSKRKYPSIQVKSW
jgi:hypothetical protein